MARPGKFSVDQVLDAALDILETEGMRALTVSGVCRALGAPSGSLYHRFASRDALLVALWLRCAERFQHGYGEVLDSEPDARKAAHAAVRWFVERARSHRAEAMVLNLYRRQDLIDGPWPDAVRRRARALAAQQREAMRRFAQRLWPEGGADLPRMEFALLRIPLAAALAELHGASPHRDAVRWVQTAADALL